MLFWLPWLSHLNVLFIKRSVWRSCTIKRVGNISSVIHQKVTRRALSPVAWSKQTSTWGKPTFNWRSATRPICPTCDVSATRGWSWKCPGQRRIQTDSICRAVRRSVAVIFSNGWMKSRGDLKSEKSYAFNSYCNSACVRFDSWNKYFKRTWKRCKCSLSNFARAQ